MDDNWIDDFAPYLMNRIMGRYNESLRLKMTSLDLTTPKMRALAVLIGNVDGMLINELAVYAVVEQSTLKSRTRTIRYSDGLIKREIDSHRYQSNKSLFNAIRIQKHSESLWPDMLNKL